MEHGVHGALGILAVGRVEVALKPECGIVMNHTLWAVVKIASGIQKRCGNVMLIHAKVRMRK